MKFAEMMYYAEAEGLLPTRVGKINAAIADIKADPRPWVDEDDMKIIFKKHGLDYYKLSPREVRYINSKIG